MSRSRLSGSGWKPAIAVVAVLLSVCARAENGVAKGLALGLAELRGVFVVLSPQTRKRLPIGANILLAGICQLRLAASVDVVEVMVSSWRW